MIGRDREYHFLEKIWASKDAFLMVTGRKYVGKSALVRYFIQDKNALYFAAANVSDSLNRNAFKAALNSLSDTETALNETASWRDLFKEYSNIPGTERKILVLDNFQYLAKGDQVFLKLLKNAWENIFSPNNIMLIIILPNGQCLTDLKRDKSFVSKISYQISLPFIPFPEMMKEWPHSDFEQLMMMYSVTGGTAKYWEYFGDCYSREDFLKMCEHLFFNPYGPLLDDPVKMIADVSHREETCHSVLYAVARGFYSLQDISDETGYLISDVFQYVSILEKTGYVEERQSVIGRKTGSTRIPSYQISDPFLVFWYRFVFPFYNDILNGETEKALDHLQTNFDDHVQKCFKLAVPKVFNQACKLKNLPFSAEDTGIFYNDEFTIDIVAVDQDKKTLFFGDCVFVPDTYDTAAFNQFVSRCGSIRPKYLKPYKDYKITYGVFANKPFEKALMDYALEKKNILLFNGITMYSLID